MASKPPKKKEKPKPPGESSGWIGRLTAGINVVQYGTMALLPRVVPRCAIAVFDMCFYVRKNDFLKNSQSHTESSTRL